MTLSIEHFAVRLSRQARRRIAALLIAGSLLSSDASGADPASDAPLGSGLAANVDREVSGNSLDYWIFSDDYCGWASAEAIVSSYAAAPLATQPATPGGDAPKPSADVTAADLAELAALEPVDVSGQKRADPIRIPAEAPAGSRIDSDSPIATAPPVATAPEGYLPYDLSREDRIALRMYPITIPHFKYVGGRRAAPVQVGGEGALDCLGYGVLWTEEALPAQTVLAAPRLAMAAPQQNRWAELNEMAGFVATEIRAATEQADVQRQRIAIAVVEAVQPGSRARQSVAPINLGRQAADRFASAYAVTEGVLGETTQRVAASWKMPVPKPRTETLERTVGEKLLARAGIEADTLNCATAGVADDVAESVCCPVERMELAAQLPLTHHLAAVGVAAATLSVPQEPSAEPDPVLHAEAIATACESAAATLERWASALRRAGDSVVRVARGSAPQGSELR